MADPRRLIDDPDGSALGRSLLASANADAPSPEGRARAARRLGISVVLAAGAGAGTEATAIAAGWKLAAVVIALGSVVGLAVWQSPPAPPARDATPITARATTSGGAAGVSTAALVTPPVPAATIPAPTAPPALDAVPADTKNAPRTPTVAPDPAAVGEAPARRAPATRARPVAPPRSPAARVAPPATVAPTPPSPAAPAAPAAEPTPAIDPVEPAPVAAPLVLAPPAPVAAPPPAPAPPMTGPSRLAAEVALVDGARRQLGAGNHRGALDAISAYRRQFPGGDLDAEADVVTIEALIAARDVARARALGTAFLARFPRSPLAQRVHSLLDRLPVRPPN